MKATVPGSAYATVEDGRQKTALLHELVQRESEDDLVRSTAMQLCRGTRDDRARLERIHRFVAQLPYLRESIERFQPVALTLTQGGDCDDHVLTKCALAWALRFPYYVEPFGDGEPMETIHGPAHYTSQLGYPASDSPWGDESTIWLPSESVIPLGLGRHVGTR